MADVRSWALSIAPRTFVIFIGNIIKNMCIVRERFWELKTMKLQLRRILFFNLLCKWEGLQAT